MRDYDPTTGRYLQADPLGLVDGASLYNYARQNPGRWTDPSGEETTVIRWDAVGWGSSSFGHASVELNGTAYSYGPNGMVSLPYDIYDDKNSFRDGYGVPLDLTPKQEQELAMCLMEPQGEYSAWSNNCTDPIESCLKKIGYDIGDSTTPVGMLGEILDGDIPKKPGIIWKSPTNPSECGCAPWVK